MKISNSNKCKINYKIMQKITIKIKSLKLIYQINSQEILIMLSVTKKSYKKKKKRIKETHEENISL